MNNWGRGGIALGHKNALGTGNITNNTVSGTEPTFIRATTPLTGANAVGNTRYLHVGLWIFGANDLEVSGSMVLSNTMHTISNGNTGGFKLSGVISGAGASVVKDGPGSMTLAGANTYDSGTVVSNGTLRLANSLGSATGAGAVTVYGPGVISGSGSMAGLLTVNGTIAPGGVGAECSGFREWAGRRGVQARAGEWEQGSGAAVCAGAGD